MARRDKDTILLTLVINEIVRRGDAGRLPPDLQGDAVTNQVHEHEAAVEARWNAHRDVKGERERAAGAFAATESMLSRLRLALLVAYPGPGDPRLAAFEPLGVGRNQQENHGRLVSIIPRVEAAVAAGELPLPADLQPAALTAQAALHSSLWKSKEGMVTSRQVEGETLIAERRQSRAMLKRLKAFVKAFYGEGALTSFGFNLPLPPRRPRLEGEPVAPGPAPATEPATTPA